MKKTFLLSALCATLLLSGCEADEKAVVTTTEAVTTTVAAETTTAASETTTVDTTTEATAESKTLLGRLPDGTELYAEDAVRIDEYSAVYDFAFAYPSSGIFYEEDTNPNLFDNESFAYYGTEALIPEETATVRAGDKIGNGEIESAEFGVFIYNDGESVLVTPSHNTVTLKGEYTFTGYLYFYYDEDYGITSGDIMFLPDYCYEGMPMVSLDAGHGGYRNSSGTTNFAGVIGGLSVYSDAPQFRLGNLFNDYADNAVLNNFVDGGTAFCQKYATVTLKNVKLEYSDQFGDGRCSAEIVSVSQ